MFLSASRSPTPRMHAAAIPRDMLLHITTHATRRGAPFASRAFLVWSCKPHEKTDFELGEDATRRTKTVAQWLAVQKMIISKIKNIYIYLENVWFKESCDLEYFDQKVQPTS